MKVMFSVFAAKTHLYNMVPLASALKASGHEVIVAVQPDILEAATGSGLSAVSVGGDLAIEEETQQATETFEGDQNLGGLAMSNPSDGPYPWEHAVAMWTAMTAFVFQNVCPEPMIDEMVEFARGWKPDLVIWDPLTLGGPVAAEAVGAAQARLLFGPDQMGNNRNRFLRARSELSSAKHDDPIEEWMSWTFRRNGISADPRDPRHVFGDWTIDPTPAQFRSYEHPLHLDMQYTAYNGPSVVPTWAIRPRRTRRVLVTLGGSLGETPDGGRQLAEALVEGVIDTEAEILLTLPRILTQHLGDLPPHVQLHEFIPLAAVLNSCDAIVHHGGSGTFLSSLRCGVPQVVIPDGMWDSYDKCRGLVNTGAGAVIRPMDATPALIQDAVSRAINGDFSQGARQVRRQMTAKPTPAELTRPLVELAHDYSRK